MADDDMQVNPLPLAPSPYHISGPWGIFDSPLAQGFSAKNLLTSLSPISAVHPGTLTQPPLIDWQVPPLAQELYRQVTNVGGALRGRNPITDQTLSDVTSLAGTMASPSVAMEMDPETLAAFNAWHGSPVTFAKTEIGHPEFLDEKMGTGEGAQAFGWGHYSAEREGTAGSYRGQDDMKIGFGDHSPEEIANLDMRAYDDRVNDETLDPALREPWAPNALWTLAPRNYRDAEQALKYMVPDKIGQIRADVAEAQRLGYARDQTNLQNHLQLMQERFDNAVKNQLSLGEQSYYAQAINETAEKLQQTPEKWAAKQQPIWNARLAVADWLERNGHKVTIHDPTSLYRTAILPDEDQLLHLDLPLASQPEGVKAALKGMPDDVWNGIRLFSQIDPHFSSVGRPLFRDTAWDAYTGHDFRKILERSQDVQDTLPDVMANGHEKTPFTPYDSRNDNVNAKNVSKYLDSIGIPGSMFFDNKSRSVGQQLAGDLSGIENSMLYPEEGHFGKLAQQKANILDKIYGPESDLTHNYIIFDPKNLMITHRNGTRLVPGDYVDAAKAFEYQDQLHTQAGLAPPTRLFPVKGDPFNPLTGPQPNLLTGTGQ